MKHIFTLLFITIFTTGFNQTSYQFLDSNDPLEDKWVNDTFNSMTEDEKIGQLMNIRAHSDKGPAHIAKVENLIKKYHVGGLTFFQGTVEKQARLTNNYQKLSKIPLMIAMDAEWGLGMRLKSSSISYPRNLMLGSIKDNSLLYEYGAQMAEEFKRMGVHVNYAPVADVNNNPKNPVINTRSFGEDRYNVAVKSYMTMRGMQDNQILACAKHYPGHGDTDTDSHYALPTIQHDMQRMDSIELFPFKILAEQGIGSMMIAHLHVPSIDPTPGLPTSLSPIAVRKMLREDMNYEGLIFTDGLGMKGVREQYKNGEIEALALVAGNDILLLPQDLEAAFSEIKRYLNEGKLSWTQLDVSVKKVLRAKYKLGLTSFTPISLTNLRTELNSPKGQAMKRKLTQHSMILVRSKDIAVPVRDIVNTSFASVSIGSKSKTKFQSSLERFKAMPNYQIGKSFSTQEKTDLIRRVKDKDYVFIGLHDISSFASKDYGLNDAIRELITAIDEETNVILTVFGTPYCVKYFDNVDWLLVAHTDDPMAQDLAAQALFGANAINGKMPVTASINAQFNQGIEVPSLFRLGYGIPEDVGLDSDTLAKIDLIAQHAIDTGATPGCVVLIAKNNKIIYQKAFGHHTYKHQKKTSINDIFDLASITKVAASTLSAMKLYDEGKIDIYSPMSTYITELDTTNKADILVHDMMTHHAALRSWIPFYEETVTSRKRPMSSIYSKSKKGDFQIKVADNLYMTTTYADSMWQQIIASNLRSSNKYKYSDLGFYMVGEMVNRVTGQPLNEYANASFYKPLGLRSTMFNPLDRYPRSIIPPTEEDRYFRQQKVHGHVHDMGSAMLGGVAGHAGLFSNAQDLAVLMQMLVNNGYYGGERYINAGVVEQFTRRCDGCSRRAIGFDMFQTDPEMNPNLSEKAPESTFGHLGFTGTCTWADPENEIVYIFLSNRTYPSMRNNKLGRLDIRPNIQDVIYDAMK